MIEAKFCSANPKLKSWSVYYVLKIEPSLRNFTPMAAELSGRRKPTKSKKHLGAQKRKRDDVDVEKLEQAVENLVCPI
jgi:hypothetical protein